MAPSLGGPRIWVFLASCEKNNAKTANKGQAKSIQKYVETVWQYANVDILVHTSEHFLDEATLQEQFMYYVFPNGQ